MSDIAGVAYEKVNGCFKRALVILRTCGIKKKMVEVSVGESIRLVEFATYKARYGTTNDPWLHRCSQWHIRGCEDVCFRD
jgi:hypothetical protein